jgi:hypothetical protein
MEQVTAWRLDFLRLIRNYQRNVRQASLFALQNDLGKHCIDLRVLQNDFILFCILFASLI